MEKFARIIIGYHGCRKDFADAILLGTAPIAEWKKSENKYDWLGSGVYFWEHSLSRAQRWAEENYADNPRGDWRCDTIGKLFRPVAGGTSALAPTILSSLCRRVSSKGTRDSGQSRDCEEVAELGLRRYQ